MGTGMRRMERQLSDDEACRLLEEGSICHLAMVDKGEPYLVTLNYGFREGTLYFHSADKGRKIDALRQGGRVCFTVVPRHELIPAEEPCGYSMSYRSVVGWGRARFLTEPDEKRRALEMVMAQYVPGEFVFPEAALEVTAVFAIDIEEMAAKGNR